MEEEAREFAEKMAKQMRSILEEGREATPVCFARTKNGDTLVVGFEFISERSKDAAAAAMRILEKMPEVEFIVFLTDAWMAELTKEELGNADLSQGVRNMPKRKEAIIANIFGRNRFSEFGRWIYERVNGKPVFSSSMEWVMPSHSAGRFAMDHDLEELWD